MDFSPKKDSGMLLLRGICLGMTLESLSLIVWTYFFVYTHVVLYTYAYLLISMRTCACVRTRYRNEHVNNYRDRQISKQQMKKHIGRCISA